METAPSENVSLSGWNAYPPCGAADAYWYWNAYPPCGAADAYWYWMVIVMTPE